MNAQGGMVTMNAAGGPVGAPMVNNVAARQQQALQDQERLNTYIYDYLCKSEHYDIARLFLNKCPVKVLDKSSPRRNGVDDMDTDSKDGVLKRPDDIPYPDIPAHPSDNAFLYDWWCQFWDIFGAARRRTPAANGTSSSESYLQHNMTQTKMRQLTQQNMLQHTNQNMLRQQFGNAVQQNGMNNMAKQAAMNRNNAPGALQQKMMANQMQRGDSSMGDNRPQSPNSMEAMGSPSKRPRTDGNFNGQPGPAGRGQSMPGQQMNNMAGNGPNGGMLLQNSLPNDMSQQQMGAFSASTPNAQQKTMEQAMNANGTPQMNGAEYDLMAQQRMNAGGATPAQGNHALQDYQMQLMLLEQQNKKRLLMARQEQDNVNHVPQGSTPGNGMGFTAPAMSPSGSRAGPSPNPNDQLKRVAGTPKMGQGVIPGSPMPDMQQNRGSPAPGFEGAGPQGVRGQFFPGMGQNPVMMGGQQPPSSHPNFQISNMNPQQMMERMNGQMPNGQRWQGAPQMIQAGQQPQQMGAQQRPNNMPPPPAPSQEQQRTQPSSPAQNAAPPTPSQSAKAGPKVKKDTAPKKKAAPKKNAAAATPAADSSEPPATPTPATPITPMHPQSFNKNGQPGNAQAQSQVAPQPMDISAPPFGDLPTDPNGFNLDFAVDGTNDVLENFDFDSFLHEDPSTGFGGFELMNFNVGDGTDTTGGST